MNYYFIFNRLLIATLMIKITMTRSRAIFTELARAHVSYDDYELTYYYDMAEIYNLTNRIEIITNGTNSYCHLREECTIAIKQIKSMIQHDRNS